MTAGTYHGAAQPNAEVALKRKLDGTAEGNAAKRFVAAQHEVDEDVMEPYRYITRLPGKNVRSKIIDAFDKWLNISSESKEAVKEVIGVLHNASLMIDDIEDNSKLRRGDPVTHAIYGIPTTINTANYVYFIALQKCFNLNNQDAMLTFVEELLNLHRGQGQDIRWRDNGITPTEQQYKQMVLDKTGGLFRLALRLMQSFSENKTDFAPLLNDLSYFFQVLDDYLNLCSEKYTENKSFCEDLTEGKYSFPIIHSLHSNPSDTRLINILRQRTEDVEKKKYAIKIMKETGSLKYTRTVLLGLRQNVYNEIERLGGNAALSAIVQYLSDLGKLDDDTTDEDSKQSN